ncbi:thioredoxin family protein [Leptolyngbya sp. FACHB-261]|uniref:thioredoxin family protein n=1 Tax=Leptolyngbya sp. FACHB-261 TaxID=2692806 RepID=UPI001689F80E|nr:thioredoxin family protein [Leptolyngbya sp. FACHB-261]MBD2103250.1 thioredoxin family protein [Leptolyngbya sp. FACHB-261]
MTATRPSLGSYAPDFELPGVDGQVHHLRRYLEQTRAVVVVFICNHCPFVRASLERIKRLQADYQDQGVVVVGINPNDAEAFPEDSFDKMKVFAQEQGLTLPYLRDVTQDVARSFSAQKTPEAFVIDSEGILRYHGRLLNDLQDTDPTVTLQLRQALDQVLAGAAVTASVEEAVGCSIKWRTY